ncbi:helix-turn-helix transcriptional regulator [Streptomyces sp. 5-10]|uniref:helix-turn-helix transcriptional regulator n=1 Tax=Streptomyces sp. 5-10 TaxID=878925 RepID=UPI00168BCD07|nr:helix-turn-helix transcriptional regulator [Streptomyces sp. 5-10]MBD3006618.1 helix-turn-helix transcriptional regulator [Streptomyces sp. 5-10]
MLIRRGEFDRVREILYHPEDPNISLFGPTIYPAELLLARSHLAFMAGDLDAAVAMSEQVLAQAGVADQLRIASRLILALAALRRVDVNAASSHMQMIADDAFMGRLTVLTGQCAWVNARVREAQWGTEGVAPFMEELVDFGPVSRNVFLSQSAAAPWLVRSALKTDQKSMARQAVKIAQKLAGMNPHHQTLAASALHAKGLFEQNLDDMWHAAETQLQPWTRASAMEDIGKCMALERSQQDQAVRILERSADTYISAGAPRDVLRIKKRLWDLGVRHHQSRWRISPQRAIVDLTETEIKVAQLVAQGMTNTQTAKHLFLSPHTVAYHLKKIFPKLQVSSRVELARVWTDIVVSGTESLEVIARRAHSTSANERSG